MYLSCSVLHGDADRLLKTDFRAFKLLADHESLTNRPAPGTKHSASQTAAFAPGLVHGGKDGYGGKGGGVLKATKCAVRDMHTNGG